MTRARAAQRLAAEVHEMKIADQSVNGRVHVHGGDDHAVGQLELFESNRGEHRGKRLAAVTEPRVDFRNEFRISQLEIPVSHAPAARKKVERKLRRLLVCVHADVLEPLQ